MRILFIADIVGQPGREAVAALLPEFKRSHQIELVVANVENIAGGSGITYKTSQVVREAGCDILTSGDHIFKREEATQILSKESFLIRPANLAESVPGQGFVLIERAGLPVGVLNLQGRVFMPPIDCPFQAARRAVSSLREKTPIIIVDFHAEATSEKVAMGWFLDGLVSACIGTHTHVQTADEKILPGGSAYITDGGMTGPHDSVIGRVKERVLERFVTGMPARLEVATKDVRLEGVLLEIDGTTGKASSIQRVRLCLDSK